MAISTLTPIEEYLATSYRPDCDYTDGVLEERNLGELDHSSVQRRFVHAFMESSERSGWEAWPELRIRVRPDKYRIPDVAVTHGVPTEQVVTSPPVLCIEVLSKDDTVTRINQRVRDYLEFGVPEVWVADPAEKTIWIYRPNRDMAQLTEGTISPNGTSIEIPLSDIFR